jgi:hypothetical protein
MYRYIVFFLQCQKFKQLPLAETMSIIKIIFNGVLSEICAYTVTVFFTGTSKALLGP